MMIGGPMRSGCPATMKRLLLGVVTLSVLALSSLHSPVAADARPTSRSSPGDQVTASADPAAVSVAPLPCDRHGEIQVTLTNTGSEPRFVDATVTAPAGLRISRSIISTYLPAGQPVRAPLTATAATGIDPGVYPVTVKVGRTRLQIPVTVGAAPGTGPGDNLARYRQAFASSTHPNVTLCGGVDGNIDSEQWGASGTHDRTAGVFPDIYGVQLDHAFRIGRVEVYTLDSATYPAAVMGIRDFDVQARVAGDWRTVGSVEANQQGHLHLTFAPVTADQLRLVVYDSNDHTFSRVVELEVFGD